MNKRIAILTILGIVLVGFIFVFVETGWPLARYKGGLTIPESASVKISKDADPLNPAQALELRAIFGRLLSVEKGIYTKPDMEIWVRNEGEELSHLSIWKAEKFVYEGYFLEAWTERMTRDRAKGFRLSREATEFLESVR